MKVVGFSFIRNAVEYDYPIVEAITSILPLCDEVVVAVGNSRDDTKKLISGISTDKIRLIDTVWDDSLREGGRVLATETNKALAAIGQDADWAFYIQGDEVLHEESIPAVRRAMEEAIHDDAVDGLLFKYVHFYGSYRYVGNSRRWYRREIRLFKNRGNVTSYRDAQGFRINDNKKLRVKLIDAFIYHYGWVKPLAIQKRKVKDFYKLWHGQEKDADLVEQSLHFSFENHIDSLAAFEGTHPAVMQDRVGNFDSSFSYDTDLVKYSLRVKILKFIEDLTGWRVGEYRNYRLIK